MPSRRRSSTSASRPLDSIARKTLDHTLRVADEMRSRLRLHDDDADAVRDHVVELARDPPSFLGDRQLRLLLALAFEPLRAVLEIGDALPSSAQVAADEPRDRERQPGRGSGAARAERAGPREVGRCDRRHRDSSDEGRAAVVAVRADRVEGEQHGQEDLDRDTARVAHEDRAEDERAGRGQERRRRRAPPQRPAEASRAAAAPRGRHGRPTTCIVAGACPQRSSCVQAANASATAPSPQRSITARTRMGGTYCGSSAGASTPRPIRVTLQGYAANSHAGRRRIAAPADDSGPAPP